MSRLKQCIRIAHFTDIHVTLPLPYRALLSKRVFNALNNVLEGKKRVFSPLVQQRLMDAIAALKPDAVVCTGDLTGTGLIQEYEKAKALIAPLMNSCKSLLIPGNHVSSPPCLSTACSCTFCMCYLESPGQWINLALFVFRRTSTHPLWHATRLSKP